MQRPARACHGWLFGTVGEETPNADDPRFRAGELQNPIDQRAYDANLGYALDRRDSQRGSSVPRHEASDVKVIVKRDMDGRYVYFLCGTIAPRKSSDGLLSCLHRNIVRHYELATGINGWVTRTFRQRVHPKSPPWSIFERNWKACWGDPADPESKVLWKNQHSDRSLTELMDRGSKESEDPLLIDRAAAAELTAAEAIREWGRTSGYIY